MATRRPKIGIWMIGAAGGVGSTVAFGLAALGKKLAKTTGLVTALSTFDPVDMVDPGAIAVGGHEIRDQSLVDSVTALHVDSRVFPADWVSKCTPAMRKMQSDIRPGIVLGATREVRSMADRRCVRNVATPAAAVRAISRDIRAFREKRRLDHVVVVNVASSEPSVAHHSAHDSEVAFRRALNQKSTAAFPNSALYALGAFSADCSYVNFTASTGCRIATVTEAARRRGALHVGRDGKTGETLLKSVLAPMFARRHLLVQSWIGHNMLGNRDGATLSRPNVREAKIVSKERLLPETLGYRPHTHTAIEYVPPLGDWKIASDYVHFQGFLQTPMQLQFTWTGCDSALAAPLVIDLVRLAALEWERGKSGRMDHLAFFFKDPDGCRRHALDDQWHDLVHYVTGHDADRRA